MDADRGPEEKSRAGIIPGGPSFRGGLAHRRSIAGDTLNSTLKRRSGLLRLLRRCMRIDAPPPHNNDRNVVSDPLINRNRKDWEVYG